MYHPTRKKEAMGDDPPYLTVGTEVSAKYKGAFCEAKVRKVVRSVKCRVTFTKPGLGSAVVTDDQIKGTLRAGSTVETRHPDKKEVGEATITRIQDCSQYTVVFDDGDITTLRRTALCLKSGRHFAESETLDQLPLTHPEHFSNPVVGGRRGRRNRHAQDGSSDEEEAPKRGKKKDEKEADIGKVVCVELGDKKKQKDNWFPGLVVAPTAQDTVRIRVKDDYLVRSFKDGRYYTVPKKEATAFTRDIGAKVDNNTLKIAVEKALMFLDKDELPPHWDREVLFGSGDASDSDSDGMSDLESSDDERQEEKDYFVAQLYKFMDECGTPINREPTIFDEDLDLFKLYKVVHKLGGYNRVTNQSQWKFVTSKLALKSLTQSTVNHVKSSYKKYLHQFEDFDRKLGCTMVNHPRGSRSRNRSGRSLIRDRDRATPVNVPKLTDKEKVTASTSGTAAAKKEAEPELDKKKPGTKGKDEKVKPEKKSAKEEEKGQPKRELKSRSERLKQREESKKKEAWRDESSDEDEEEAEEGGSSSSGRAEESQEMDNDEESESSAGKPSEKSLAEQRSRRRPAPERSMEEEEKTVRLRSKGSGRSTPDRGRSRENKTPVRDVEKKMTRTSKGSKDEEALPPPSQPQPNQGTNTSGPPPMPKKRGRKRKDSEKSSTAEDKFPRLPSEVQIQVGDKLKVYYGQDTPTNKFTYEAKVIDVTADGCTSVRVHYLGWNNRYDEWIPRVRIAENLSWTWARAKKSRLQQQQQQQQQSSSSQPSSQSTKTTTRGRALSRSQSETNTPQSTMARSTTPSSVTSSSSRTKSPAQSSRAQRAASRSEHASASQETKSGSSMEFRRRTRRTSGHADLNISESESEDSDSESMEVAEPEPMGLRRRRMDSESSVKVEPKDVTTTRQGARRRLQRKEQSDDEEEQEDSDTQRRGRGRRTRRVTESEKKEEERSSTPAAPTQSSSSTSQQESKVSTKVSNEDEPKGRDFDLNQIRSELKGLDKAVKSPVELVTSDTDAPVVSTVKSETELSSMKSPEVKATAEKKEDASASGSKKPAAAVAAPAAASTAGAESKDDTDDIYEFKEPEPFEFEVRGKRETSLAEERTKLTKRPMRLFDDLPPEPKTSPKKKPTPKKDSKASPSLEDISAAEEAKKRRRIVGRKFGDDDEDSESGEKIGASTPKPKAPMPETPSDQVFKKVYESATFSSSSSSCSGPKSEALSASEKAFKRLYASTTFPVLGSPHASSSKMRSSRPLDLFEDPPTGTEDDRDEEAVDRLVITEADSETPLFSYQMRHEEMLPTPISGHSSESEFGKPSSDLMCLFESTSGIKKSGAAASSAVGSPPGGKLTALKSEGEEGTPAKVERPVQIHDDVMELMKDKEEVEDDPINATIQRVISQSMAEESSDVIKMSKPVPTRLTPIASQAGPPAMSKLTPKVAQTLPRMGPKMIDTSAKASPKMAETSTKTAQVAKPGGQSPSNRPGEPRSVTKLTDLVCKPISPRHEPAVKVTPKLNEPGSKSPSKVMPGLESVGKGPLKVPVTPELPTKGLVKMIPDTSSKSTPRPISSAELAAKVPPKPSPSTETLQRTPKPTPELGKGTSRSSPETFSRLSKTAEVPKQRPIQSPEAVSKALPKMIATPEGSGVKLGVKGSPSSEIFGRQGPAETPKPTPKGVPALERLPKVSPSLIATKMGSPIDTQLGKVSGKVGPSVEPLGKSSPRATPESSKAGSSKVLPQTPKGSGVVPVIKSMQGPSASRGMMPESFSKVKSPLDTAKTKIGTPESMQSKVGVKTPSEAFGRAASKAVPQLTASSSLSALKDRDSLKRETKKETRKKALKKTVSKEFVDDSSSDSDSSEGLKLVIDKLEDESGQDSSDAESDVKKETRTSVRKSEQRKVDSVIDLDRKRKAESEGESSKKLHLEDQPEEEEMDSSLHSLLCEETIPRSPLPPEDSSEPPVRSAETPKVREIPFASMPAGGNGAGTSSQQQAKVFAGRSTGEGSSSATSKAPSAAPVAPKEDEAAPVMDNTPPTTPDSSISTISGSPREDRVGSPHRDESNKSARDSSEVDLDSPTEGHKNDPFSEDSLLNVEVSSSCDATVGRPKGSSKRHEAEVPESPSKRRRRVNKKDESPPKRMRHGSGRSPRNIGGGVGGGSDSDDNSENSNFLTSNFSNTDNLLANRSPRPSKYNFYVELDPELDGTQRIALLQHKLQELRKTYMSVKAELACIDRRRKKLRRREREGRARRPVSPFPACYNSSSCKQGSSSSS